MMHNTTPQYASFGARLVSFIIDNVIFAIALSPIFAAIFGVKEYTDEEVIKILQTKGLFGLIDPHQFVIQQLTLLAITIFFWVRFCGTPGKRLLKLKVIDAKTGKPLTALQSMVRYLGYFISALPAGMGFVWILIDDKNQAWHDKLAGSIVVQEQTAGANKDSSEPDSGENSPVIMRDKEDDKDDTFTA